MPIPFVDAMHQPVKADAIAEGTAVNGFFADKRALVLRKNNELTVLTSVCTHQQCTVALNRDQQTIDCPCHGSRYKLDGKVFQGPAQKNLAKFGFEVRDNQVFLKD
jgi:cytochrome b6-f complex iron-sulfur subunit